MEKISEQENYNVVFAGLDYNVFSLLLKETKVNLAGVNLIEDFLTYKTSNIADILFKQVYSMRASGNNYAEEQVLLNLYKPLSVFASELYKRYTPYLIDLSNNRIPIVDLAKTENSVNFLKSNEVDSLVISNWWILPDEIIYAPKKKTVNIHPSELPKYRGSVPTLWAMKNHDPEIAVSFMVIDSSVDGGDIIAQHKFPIEDTDDSIDVENKSDETIRKYFIPEFLKYMRGETKLLSQDQSKASKTAKYYPYMEINWESEAAKDIADKIKLYPHLWPIDMCYTSDGSRKVHFTSAEISNSKNNNRKPAEYWIKGNKLMVQATDAVLSMTLFKDMSVKDSIRYLIRRKGAFRKN